MREVYPHLPLFERQGLGVALLSYAGRLHVGIAADWSHGALLADLIDRVAASFDELAGAAGVDRPAEPATPRVHPAPLAPARVSF
jgi:hypothetical protein